MKKKSIYLLVLSLLILSPIGKVDATKKTPSKTSGDCTATLQLNRMHDGAGNNYWNIKANGKQAFCIDPGKKAFSGEKCQTMPAGSATADQRRVISYASKSGSVVQGSGLSNSQQQQVYIALSKGDYDAVKDIVKNNSNAGLANSIVSEFKSTAPANLGSGAVIMYCNGDKTGNTYQRMIVNANQLGCTPEPDPDDPADMSCTDGMMNLDNPSTSCYSTFNGIETYYSYTASGGGDPYVHSQYGEALANPGAYCHMFCQEYGTSVLPGALGTSIQAGSHIIWPTSENNQINKFTKDMYPMYVKGKKECKLVMMPDHGNYPTAGTGGCNSDPYGDYVCLYNASSEYQTKRPKSCKISASDSLIMVGNEPDVFGTRFESVRIANNNYFNEPEYCGDYMTAIAPAVCSTGDSFEKDKLTNAGHSKYYNGVIYGLYNAKVQDINSKADDAKQKCEDAKAAKDALDAATEAATAAVGTKDESAKADEKNAAQAAYNAAQAAYQAAISAHEQAVNFVKVNIYNSIKRCQYYIKNFNIAREILDAIADCGNFSVGDASSYYNFMADGSISFANGDYSVIGPLQQSGGGVSCSGGCSGLGFTKKPGYLTLDGPGKIDTPAILKGKVQQIENREIILTANEIKFELQDGYSYINKRTNEYSKYPLSTNYVDIPTLNGGLAKVLPTDYNSPVVDKNNTAIQYDLILNNVMFGDNYRFQVNNGSNYVCKYTMTKESSECVCPQDTPGDGKNLMDHVVNEKMSCAEAQAKYCSSPGGGGECGEACFCVFDDKVIDISGCIKTGIGVDACRAKLCSGNSYKCKNTNGLRTGMDITGCVGTKMAQGYNLDQALAYCDEVVCPIGKTIIYRTIRLENPFPGKNISGIVEGFNNEVKGRYPGYNWNGKTLVYNKIRNNRKVSGTTIYQVKNPIYSFELNGATIERIREYNRTMREGYNDFHLTCMKNHHAACISSFLRNKVLSGMTGGVCSGVSNDNGFYSCLNN